MSPRTANDGAIFRWTAIGTVLQLAMVLIGHWVMAIANLFGILGTLIALVVGLLFGSGARATPASGAGGGAVVGGVSAFLGTVVSWLLGDVTPVILLVGAVSGLVAGGIGGLIGGAMSGRRARTA